MKLVHASLAGFGRFNSAKINLAGKLIAIVGPNEAGKTSLLKALNHLTSGRRLPGGLSSRPVIGHGGPSEVSAVFEVEEPDLAGIDVSHIEAAPKQLIASRTGDEEIVLSLRPRPSLKTGELTSALTFLHRAADSKASKELLSMQAPADGEEPSDDYLLSLSLRSLTQLLDRLAFPPAFADREMQRMAESAANLFSDPRWEKHESRFQVVRKWVGAPDPGEAILDALWSVTPDFAFFEASDRDLSAAYPLSDELISKPPSALTNLCGLAGLDLNSLLVAQQTGNKAEIAKLLIRANKRLESRFHATWGQAKLSVHLSLDAGELRLLIHESDDEVTEFNERSAGLRAFIALIAFVESGSFEPPPVLLIDEAEQHLHIDAQAELVAMLEAQQYASKVVYTTHSPACLPTDLGSRVRVVEPLRKNSPGSAVRNHFWVQGVPGFSPLMMAMGASAAAFTPSRVAVIAEGATEMILLPRLLREAARVEALSYQIAPGLSEAPVRIYPELDLEAARVLFLVDADSAGRSMAAALEKAGVDRQLIVESPAARLELLIEPARYLHAANEELRACNPEADAQIVRISGADPYGAVKRFCGERSLLVPSKIAIVSRLADDAEPIVSARYIDGLAALHHKLDAGLWRGRS